MRRRELITLIGGSVAWPLTARTQQPGKVHRIGFLANDPAIPTQPAGRAFLEGLRESGFIEGKNVIIDRRFAEGRGDQYDGLIADLAQLNPDVLVTSADEATLAAKRAAIAIPVVMMNVSDPVGQGLVASLARPGGITGVIQDDSAEISAKRMQLLKDAVPRATKVAVLLNPDHPYDRAQWQRLELAAPSLRVTLRQLVAGRASELEGAFASIGTDRPDVLLLPISSPSFANRRLIIELALKDRLPVMSPFREVTEIGGLMSYGSVRVDRFRRAAIYVGKVLKGAKPADLPVEQPTKYELIINLKTARLLGLEIPRDLLLVADDVIE